MKVKFPLNWVPSVGPLGFWTYKIHAVGQATTINIKLHKITNSLRGVFEVLDAQNPTTAKTIISLIVTFRLSFKTTEVQHLVKEFHNEFVRTCTQKKKKVENT